MGPRGAQWGQFLLKVQLGRQSMVLRMVPRASLLAGAAGARCGLVTGKAECGLGAGEDPPGTGGSANTLRTVCSAAWISEEKTVGSSEGRSGSFAGERPLGGAASSSPGAHRGRVAPVGRRGLRPQRGRRGSDLAHRAAGGRAAGQRTPALGGGQAGGRCWARAGRVAQPRLISLCLGWVCVGLRKA